MNGLAVYGERACMPTSMLRALLDKNRRQATTIQDLRQRIQSRETLLMRTLHELALLRGEKDPRNFMFRRGQGGGQPGRP